MPRIIEKTVYKFDELSDDAKENARDWWREGGLDYEWYDCVLEDAKDCGKLLGIDIDKIYFTGFHSQGDGACFEGSYEYRRGWRKELKANIGGQDLSKLERIGEALQDIQRRAFYKVTATTNQRGHYMHSNCMDVTVDASEAPNIDEAWAWNHSDDDWLYEGIKEELRSFAGWIYEKLEQEYNYLMSDDAIDETILANEYEFDINGERV